MGTSEFTVICFDVGDDRRRRRVVRVLEAYGWRAQESVFETWLDETLRQSMIRELSALVDRAEDRVAIYVLPSADHADIVSLGHGQPATDFFHAIV